MPAPEPAPAVAAPEPKVELDPEPEYRPAARYSPKWKGEEARRRVTTPETP
jgi:hypothetical protein